MFRSAPQFPAPQTEEYHQDYTSHESYDNYDYQQGEAAMVEDVGEQMDQVSSGHSWMKLLP
jgi:hypothetical protein